MRNTEKRVQAVKLRVKEMKREKKRKHHRVIGLSSMAACLLMIIGLSFAMQRAVTSSTDGTYQYSNTTASIFNANGASGYIVIGLVAFALGISITVLCYCLRRYNREKSNCESGREENDD